MRRLTLLLLLARVWSRRARRAGCDVPDPEDDVPRRRGNGLERAGGLRSHTDSTVSRGKTIDTFPVTVLGVLKDGIGVGHDMIIVDVHDYAAMDDTQHGVHGIWAGMSGSPVYTNEASPRLIGSVSFGLSTGASTDRRRDARRRHGRACSGMRRRPRRQLPRAPRPRSSRR